MTKEEIITRIEQLNKRLFLMNMIDRWTHEDRKKVTEMTNELYDLEMQLAQTKEEDESPLLFLKRNFISLKL